MAKKKPKIDHEKFGWQPGDLKHHRNFGAAWFTVLNDEARERFKKCGYDDNGNLPEWDSLTDEQKIRFAPYRNLYDTPAD